MNFIVEKKDSYTIFKVVAEKLDSNISSSAKSELMNLNNSGVKNIIMEMSAVKYCDSSGLSAILVGNRLCKNSGGKFVISGVQELVSKLISISQLDSILKITKTTEEATKLF